MTEIDDQTPRTFSPRDSAGLFVRGIGMGAADVVPGVSGGTIAFITGIYERFVGALKSVSAKPITRLVRNGPRAGLDALLEIDWRTLLPLGLGIVTAIVALSKLILGLMESRPGPTYALFFGLIAASAYTPIARIKKITAKHVAAIALAAVGAFFLVGMTPSGATYELTAQPANASHALALEKVRSAPDFERMDSAMPDGTVHAFFDPKGITNADLLGDRASVILTTDEALGAFVDDHPNLALVEAVPPALPYVFLCGVIAISAMILPGLSGSFLLLMLGVYASVFGALHRVIDTLTFWSEPDVLTTLSARAGWADFALVALFLVGVVVGLGTFSRVVAWLFERAHDVTMAALTGLMIGALRLPYARIVADPASDAGSSYWAIILLVAGLGAGVVLALHLTERRLSARGADGS